MIDLPRVIVMLTMNGQVYACFKDNPGNDLVYSADELT